jgi:hypothetical protein
MRLILPISSKDCDSIYFTEKCAKNEGQKINTKKRQHSYEINHNPQKTLWGKTRRQGLISGLHAAFGDATLLK